MMSAQGQALGSQGVNHAPNLKDITKRQVFIEQDTTSKIKATFARLWPETRFNVSVHAHMQTEVISQQTLIDTGRGTASNHSISQTQKLPGLLDHLSILLLVENHSKDDPASGEVIYTPLSVTELTELRQTLMLTSGIDLKRGDRFIIKPVDQPLIGMSNRPTVTPANWLFIAFIVFLGLAAFALGRLSRQDRASEEAFMQVPYPSSTYPPHPLSTANENSEAEATIRQNIESHPRQALNHMHRLMQRAGQTSAKEEN